MSAAITKKNDEIERIKNQNLNEYHNKHTFTPKINNKYKKNTKKKLN